MEVFSSLVGFPCRGREIRPLQELTNAKALAGALLELANVSNGNTKNVTFEGGLDCGWIAVVAQWLFSLSLQILDHSGNPLYSNIDARDGAEPQVTIKQHINDGSGRTATLVSSRSFLVPPGSLSFQSGHGFLEDDPDHTLFSRGRSNWSGILHDTFGSPFHDLLKVEAISIFTSILCKALVSKADMKSLKEATLRCPWEGYHGHDIPRRLDAFLCAAAQQLPELQSVRDAAIENPDIFKDAEAFSTLKVNSYEYEDGLHGLRHLCTCNNCVHFAYLCLQRREDFRFRDTPDNMCLERIVYTIFEFLWTLSWLDLHESIKPSSTGLTMMYFTHTYGSTSFSTTKAQILERGIGVGLFPLFNGLTSPNKSYPRSLSAAYENGLCIYLSSQSLDTMPPATLRLTVFPSQIQFNERIYSQVSDHGFNNTVYIRGPPSQHIDKIGVYPEVELLVEETARSSQLKVKFQVQSRAVSANYLGYQNHLDKAGDERWERKHVPYNLQSIRPWTLWRKMYQHTIQRIEHCWHSKVEVLLTQRASLGSDLVSTLSWTGDCSELPSIGDPNWLPGANEWILVDYSPGSNYYTDVIRARLIIYILHRMQPGP